ncbi:MAG: N-acetylmuramoyl-L-alanine amidase [Planctomycetes bacterium]|nr:N-acetylmuramoyl-L-alanine amidase [Planctomycetota bacterium]
MVVWVSFAITMTIVGGFLVITDPAPAPPLSSFAAMDVSQASPRTVFDTAVDVQREDRWLDIVIHDSGLAHGSVEAMAREHQARGLHGLGYHFLIGNGNGMGDGELHVGYRWNEQLAGAHALGPQANQLNQHAIGICLIGNGNRRPFTQAQIDRLLRLVVGLQKELGIPLDHVRLHRDVTSGVNSPGRLFPTDFFLRLSSLGNTANQGG